MMSWERAPSDEIVATASTPTTASATPSGACASRSLLRRVTAAPLSLSVLAAVAERDDLQVEVGGLRNQPVKHGAAQKLSPHRSIWAPNDDVAHGMGACEIEDRGHRLARLEPHHLGAQLARLLDVRQQVALGFGIDQVGRLAWRLYIDHEPVGVEPSRHA